MIMGQKTILVRADREVTSFAQPAGRFVGEAGRPSCSGKVHQERYRLDGQVLVPTALLVEYLAPDGFVVGHQVGWRAGNPVGCSQVEGQPMEGINHAAPDTFTTKLGHAHGPAKLNGGLARVLATFEMGPEIVDLLREEPACRFLDWPRDLYQQIMCRRHLFRNQSGAAHQGALNEGSQETAVE
ncbi:MAG: hypothetical protein AB1758_33470, partial [Candidatus Eremiobacterota bacterium]